MSNDLSKVVQKIVSTVQPTRALALALAESQRSRILDRTGRGRDFQSRPLVEYSTRGPVYYYPAGRAKGRTQKSKSAAAGRLFSKITGAKAGAHKGKKNALSGRAGEAWVTPGGGLGFSSYAALKKWAGRNNVDLRGLRAPHMVQGMQVKASSKARQIEAVIGIYGEAAGRAQGHNQGTKHLPQRKFLAASKRDEAAMIKEVEIWIARQTENS